MPTQAPDAPAPAPSAEARRWTLPCTVNLPTPDMIRGRLMMEGWESREMTWPGFHLYTIVLPDWGDAEFELVLPDQDDREGWQRHVEQALRVFAGLEDRDPPNGPDRPLGDIAAEIIADAAHRGRAAEGGEDGRGRLSASRSSSIGRSDP